MCKHQSTGALNLKSVALTYMKYESFIESLDCNEPGISLEPVVKALWYDKKGNWESAHSIVQDLEGSDPALVHAYLHRKEGDDWNARYWYKRAGRKPEKCAVEQEWEGLVKEFLAEQEGENASGRPSSGRGNS